MYNIVKMHLLSLSLPLRATDNNVFCWIRRTVMVHRLTSKSLDLIPAWLIIVKGTKWEIVYNNNLFVFGKLNKT